MNMRFQIPTRRLTTEDISVEHANVETAYFDLKARKVVLPNWKDILNCMIYFLAPRSVTLLLPHRGLA